MIAGVPSYVVIWSRQAKESLLRLGEKLRKSGGSASFAQLVKDIDSKLRLDPLQVGEPYRIKGIVEERIAVQTFLAIDFAVDKVKKVVLVRSCRALSGHGV